MLNVLRYKYSEDHVTVLTTHYIIIRIMYFNKPHYMTILLWKFVLLSQDSNKHFDIHELVFYLHFREGVKGKKKVR